MQARASQLAQRRSLRRAVRLWRRFGERRCLWQALRAWRACAGRAFFFLFFFFFGGGAELGELFPLFFGFSTFCFMFFCVGGGVFMCAVPHSALRSLWLKKRSAACRRASLPVILDFHGSGAADYFSGLGHWVHHCAGVATACPVGSIGCFGRYGHRQTVGPPGCAREAHRALGPPDREGQEHQEEAEAVCLPCPLP